MQDNFDKCLDVILGHEGGYSNHSNDRGGATNFGITQKTYDTWRTKNKFKKQSVKNITRQEIDLIYYSMYWEPSKCDILPNKIDCLIFDIAVNSGVLCAVRTLQRCIGVLDDGMFGKLSMAALNDIGDMDKLRIAIIKDRILQYSNIVVNDCKKAIKENKQPTQFEFLNGWLKRISSYI